MQCHIHGGADTDRSFFVPHHVVPRAYGGPDHESNIVWLCASCHTLLHQIAVKMVWKKRGEALDLASRYPFLVNSPKRQKELLRLAGIAASSQIQHQSSGEIPEAGQKVKTVRLSLEVPEWLHHHLKTLAKQRECGLYRYCLSVLENHAMLGMYKPGATRQERFDPDAESNVNPDDDPPEASLMRIV